MTSSLGYLRDVEQVAVSGSFFVFGWVDMLIQ